MLGARAATGQLVKTSPQAVQRRSCRLWCAPPLRNHRDGVYLIPPFPPRSR
jgi:hypothetical protein